MAERDPTGLSVSDHSDQSERSVEEEIIPNRENYLQLPGTLMQAYAMKTTQHTGMYMVQLSIEAQRACNEAIVFVYGLSGHGKSQSLNHLFGFNVIPVDKISKASDTKSITEYVVKLVSDSWEVKNLEIGFIDAPGWGDTEGEHQDAKNMAAIQQFIEHHPHLGSRIYKCYPNIILIAVNATEKRLDGPESGLCKMLNSLKQLNVVDKKRPNLLFILTHAMAVPPGDFEEEVGQLTCIIKRNCKSYLGVEPMVVCLENKTDIYGLVIDGDWTVLERNGERQPLNLFRSMVKLMTSNGDEVGVEAIRIYFPNRGENPPIERSTISSDQIKLETVQKWRRIITQKTKSIINDECTKLIKKYEQENKKIPKDTFKPLMYEFNKAGINNKQQIHDKDIIEVQEIFFPFILGELEIDLIISQFGVRSVHYPEILQEFGTGLFQNDNTRLPDSPIFQYAPSRTRKGVMLPECIHIRYCEDTQVVCSCITGEGQDESNSLAPGGLVHFGPTDTEQLLISQNPRRQYLAIDFQKHKFAFAIIHNIFRMDLQMTQAMLQHVSDEFKQAIKDLPDPQHREQDLEYLQLIRRYGDCFRSTLEGGGIISGEIELQIPKGHIPQTELLIKNHIQIYLTTMKWDLAKETQLVEDGSSRQILNELFKCALNWNGGMRPEIEENNLGYLDDFYFSQWKRSLHRNPITVDKVYSRIETNHVYEIVGQFNRAKAIRIKQCLVHNVEELEANNNDFEVTMLCHERSQHQMFSYETSVRHESLPQPGVQPEPGNRRQAAEVTTSITGYPKAALVTRKRDRDQEAEVVEIEQVNEGEWILCIDENLRLIYDQVVRADKTNGDFYYLKFGYARVKNFIAANKCHIVSTDMKVKRADKTLVRDKIYSVVTEGETKYMVYEVGSVKICKEPGNVRLVMHSREDLLLIVDGIVFGEPSCFPGNASVELRGGERVRMDELKIGDYVLSIHPTTGKPVYSRVYLWAHRDPHITATFLHITHPHGHLHISADHLILSGDQRRPVPADQLGVGDSIHFLSPCLSKQEKEGEKRGYSHTLISVPVLHIQTCTQEGHYAPFTNNGLIVVDGIAASVYSHISTHSQSDSSSSSSSWLWSGVWHSVTSGLVQQFGMQRVGQCVLTPVRVGCKLGMGSVLSQQMDTNTHIHKYCQSLLNVYKNL